jgi:phosphatidylinositol phospholipase C delta
LNVSTPLSNLSPTIYDIEYRLPCFTVDIWSGEDDSPIITHGRTLTTKISARDAIQAIARYAFLASSYPIILSLEIHCGVIQQDKLVEELIEAFGDRLVVERIDNEKGEEILRLPSPEDLRGKVLLKVCLFLFP